MKIDFPVKEAQRSECIVESHVGIGLLGLVNVGSCIGRLYPKVWMRSSGYDIGTNLWSSFIAVKEGVDGIHLTVPILPSVWKDRYRISNDKSRLGVYVIKISFYIKRIRAVEC